MKSSRCPLVACSDVMGSSVTDILGAAEALAPAGSPPSCRGKLAERIEVEFGPFRPAASRRAECLLVALPTCWDLLLCAKHLLVEANRRLRAKPALVPRDRIVGGLPLQWMNAKSISGRNRQNRRQSES